MASGKQQHQFEIPRFTAWLVLRALLIVLTATLIGIVWTEEGLFFNRVILALIFTGQLVEFIYYINRTNRELARLLSAVEYADYTISFDGKKMGGTFSELAASLTGVALKLRDVKIEKEGQYLFLQKLVEQMDIGVIALQGQEVVLINPAAQELLGANGMRNWKLIEEINPTFSGTVNDLGNSGRRLMEFTTGTESRTMIVKVGTISILGVNHRIITIQDINSEVEQKEIEAWHKLINILTHEIMNSITPVSSLTETMQTILRHRDGTQKTVAELTPENIQDLLMSLATIHRRSEALQLFVESYRKITRVPRPSKAQVNMRELVAGIGRLMNPQLSGAHIDLKIDIDPLLILWIDATLIEQVLINLLTNSIHALQDRIDKCLTISSKDNGTQVIIEVRDNGRGIPENEIRQIFIPFFTTREDGSGIGLSLSRQIMASHGGAIRVKSELGIGTSFFLYFSKRVNGI